MIKFLERLAKAGMILIFALAATYMIIGSAMELIQGGPEEDANARIIEATMGDIIASERNKIKSVEEETVRRAKIVTGMFGAVAFSFAIFLLFGSMALTGFTVLYLMERSYISINKIRERSKESELVFDALDDLTVIDHQPDEVNTSPFNRYGDTIQPNVVRTK